MYLIDGYNLLYQTDFEHPSDLIAQVTLLCRAKNKRALIIFDGFSPEELSSAYVEVRFSGDADEEITNLIKQNNNPTEITLVSSDNDLLDAARQKRIHMLKSEQFCYLLNVDFNAKDAPEKPSTKFMTDKQVEEELQSYNYFKSNK